MTFKEDVEATEGLSGAWRPGIQALEPQDRERVEAPAAGTAAGSVNIDASLARLLPNDARWDYCVAVDDKAGKTTVHWIEVHSANGGGVISKVEQKTEWLLAWLRGSGNRLRRHERRIVWIASGKSAYHPASPQLRRLTARGVRFVGRHYTLGQ